MSEFEAGDKVQVDSSKYPVSEDCEGKVEKVEHTERFGVFYTVRLDEKDYLLDNKRLSVGEAAVRRKA